MWGVAMSHGAVGDRGVVTDVDVVTPGDAPTPRDVGMETDAGPMPTGLTVRAQGVATSGAASATVGTLPVSERASRWASAAASGRCAP